MDNHSRVLLKGGGGHRPEKERDRPAEEAQPAREAFASKVPGRCRDPLEKTAKGGSLGSEKGDCRKAVVRAGPRHGSGGIFRPSAAAEKQREVHAHPVEGSPLRPGCEFSFRVWASSLVRRVLKSGTSFAHFVATALPLHRDSSLPVASALFPLPLPSSLAAGRSRKRRRTLAQHVSVVLCVVVLALNFLHAEGKHVPPEALRRPPSKVQSSALCRLRELVKACARLGGSLLQPGRKGLQLAARHAEVLDFLSSSGLQDDCYLGRARPHHDETFVPHLPGGPEELRPYRDLDPSRVTLSGRGQWRISEHLDPGLLLPFLEPRALLTFVPQPAPGPSFKHERSTSTMGLRWACCGSGTSLAFCTSSRAPWRRTGSPVCLGLTRTRTGTGRLATGGT